MKLTRFRLLFLLITAATFGMGTQEAQAKKGLLLITHGDTITEIGDVKEPPVHQGITYSKIGFHYDYFGVFWLDLWNWGGEYVIYDGLKEDAHGSVISKEEAAAFMGVEESKFGSPLNYKFPYGLDIILALGLLKFVPRAIAKRKQAKAIPAYNPANATVPQWTPPLATVPPPAPVEAGPGVPPPVPPPMPPQENER